LCCFWINKGRTQYIFVFLFAEADMCGIKILIKEYKCDRIELLQATMQACRLAYSSAASSLWTSDSITRREPRYDASMETDWNAGDGATN
jgi:hypothetical protein